MTRTTHHTPFARPRLGRRLRARLTAAGVLLGATVSLGARAQDPPFVVVVNAANPVAALPREQVARLFLRKVKVWPNGTLAEPVDLAPDDPTRATFSRVVLGKSVGSVRAYWQQRIFSGAEVPPPEKASAVEVLEIVRARTSAVAYVAPGVPLPAGVRALEVDP